MKASLNDQRSKEEDDVLLERKQVKWAQFFRI